MLRDCTRLKENILKYKKDIYLKRIFAIQRKMFALKDYFVISS